MTYLSVLGGIETAALITLQPIIFPWLLPRPLKCRCALLGGHLHPETAVLLVGSILAGVIAVVDLYEAFFQTPWWILTVVVYGLWSWLLHRQWKKHKNGRKRGSLAKLLARVKATAAGLRVVPVKA